MRFFRVLNLVLEPIITIFMPIMENIYSKVGPIALKQLVNTFYDEVVKSPVISHLFVNDIHEIKAKQYLFLTQFLGGPQLYSQTYGHPRMRMRHLPHRIDLKAKEEWLRCMKMAVDSLNIDEQLKAELYGVFPPIAQHMVNS